MASRTYFLKKNVHYVSSIFSSSLKSQPFNTEHEDVSDVKQ